MVHNRKDTAGRGAPALRPRVRRNVTAAIGADICGGRFLPGSPLPWENDLREAYGVSRTVIRESLKVLETRGLVHGRPRVGTIFCARDLSGTPRTAGG